MVFVRTSVSHTTVSFLRSQIWISKKNNVNTHYGASRIVTDFVNRLKSTKPSAMKSPVPQKTEDSVPIIQTIASMAAGVTTVSLFTALVDCVTSADAPLYSPSGTRFDPSTYMGRFYGMLLDCDPRLLLHNQEEVRRCHTMLNDHISLMANTPSNKSLQEMSHRLWKARRIVSSTGHDDETHAIPRPFRMSGYVPLNGPVCVAMVVSTSTPALLFWSWINQSQNALVNYYNRAEGCEMASETLRNSYIIAVTSALTVAFGLATWIQRRYNPSKARQLMKYVAFPSAMLASSLNCYIIRSPEIETGVTLFDEHGQDVLPGTKSQEAARRGVYTTTASRALLQAPVFVVPPLLLATIPVLKTMVKRQPAMVVPLTTYMVMVAFGLGLPAAVAIFPRISEIEVEDLEEKFRQLRKKENGVSYKTLYYNKGL